MFDGGERHEGVVDSAAGDPDLSEYFWEAAGNRRAEEQRLDESLAKQPGSVGGRQPEVAGQAGENRVGLCQRMTAERDLAAVPPASDSRV